jgi:hypothetical protein
VTRGLRLTLQLFKHSQRFGRTDDADTCVSAESKNVPIARDQKISAGGYRSRYDVIVVGIGRDNRRR